MLLGIGWVMSVCFRELIRWKVPLRYVGMPVSLTASPVVLLSHMILANLIGENQQLNIVFTCLFFLGMNKIEPLFIIKSHFHFLFCELPIHSCCQFFFLIIKNSLHMKGISSMNVLYVSNIFSHFVVFQNYLISLTLLIFFYYDFRILCSTPSSVSTQGDCPALPGFPSLHFVLEIWSRQ